MRQRPDALILIAVYEFVMAAMLLIASCIVLPIALLITPFASDGFGQFAARFALIGVSLTIIFGFAVASGIVGLWPADAEGVGADRSDRVGGPSPGGLPDLDCAGHAHHRLPGW